MRSLTGNGFVKNACKKLFKIKVQLYRPVVAKKREEMADRMRKADEREKQHLQRKENIEKMRVEKEIEQERKRDEKLRLKELREAEAQ
jgi:hypothetical protein